MDPIRVAWGSAVGPTAMSSFDAALADANSHDYNLVVLSSVVPGGATVERAGTLPDLGPAGESLPVVLSRETVLPGAGETAVAGLGWVRSESGRGLFYEASGTDREAVRRAIDRGLDHATDLRNWQFETDPAVVVESHPPAATDHATAVVLAAYGTTDPLLGTTQRG